MAEDEPRLPSWVNTLYNVCNTMGGAQYRGCSVPWGFSTVGDIMSTVGDGSVPWGDTMMHVGGYHEYHGGIS